MDDLVTALSADRDLGSTALDIEMSLNVIQGAELASSPYGIVYATLSVIFHRVG